MGIALGIARSVRGRVAEVLVEVFSVPEDFQRHLPLADRLKLGDLGVVRLGSAITDARGEFRIEFGTPDAREAGRDKPLNLWLIGSINAKDAAAKLVHQEPDVRRQAGLVESFIVVVPESELVPIPEPEPVVPTDDVRRVVKDARDLTSAVADASKITFSTRASRRRRFATDVAPALLNAISTVSRGEDGKPTDPDYVGPDDSVRDQSHRRMTEEIRTRFQETAETPLRLPGRVSLTDAQLEGVRAVATPTPGGMLEIPEEKLHEVLGKEGLNPSLGDASLSRVEVVRVYCRAKTKAEQCLEDGASPDHHHDEPPGGTGDTPPPPVPNEIFHDISAEELSDRLPGFVSALLNERTALDAGIQKLKGPGQQLTEDDIRTRQTFPNLSLPPGPADVPAYYDFDKLQIAFKPLWTEALDDKLIADAEAAFDRYVELGGDPSAVDGATGWSGFKKQLSIVFSDPPPVRVVQYFDFTPEEWALLPADHKASLLWLADKMNRIQDEMLHRELLDKENNKWHLTDGLDSTEAPLYNTLTQYVGTRVAAYRAQGERIVRYARDQLERRAAAQSVIPNHRILSELKTRALSQYPARYFAANRKERSVNFGVLVTYRQSWTPTAYQVGELVQSIALAPGESRKFTKKMTVKEKRSRKEVNSNLSAQKNDSKSMSRAEAEIVQRAQQKTNFQVNAEGSFKVGIADVKGSNTITTDAQADSSETKKSLHEATVSAAQEYKDELKIELETEQTFDSEAQESGEVSNPNQELTVTYLFYELQRRFRVSERLHRLRSVVLVAQEMPQPSEIDEDWLIAHRWILNRVLLDDGFRAPLAYVAEGMAAEEHSLTELKRALMQQSRLVDDLKGQVQSTRWATDARYGALQASLARSASATEHSEDGGGLWGIAKYFTWAPAIEALVSPFVDGEETEKPETARLREAASRDAYERELEKLRDLESRLLQENHSLAAMTRAYADRLSAHLGQVVRVTELQAHVKDNIIHYMQAIWLHEPPDQRWLRLKDVPVPDFVAGKRTITIDPTAVTGGLATATHTGARMYRFHAPCATMPVAGVMPTKPLIEVADIDALLGFKANYMIFALKKPNALTSFMMQPYVEQAAEGFGITDPDDLGNISLEEFGDYVCCLRKNLDAPVFAALKDTLTAQLATLLQSPVRENEEIVVPLNALYIEALPGSKPLLENFKLLHRQIDAADALENLRLKKMEKVRYAQRLLEGELRDPDITANYLFEGAPGVAVTPPSPGGGGGGPAGPPP